MSGPITRRAFLGTAAGLGAGAAAARLRPWTALVRVIPPTDADRLAGLFADRASARAVGRASLRALGGHTRASALVDEVAAGLPDGRRTIAEAGEDDLRELLAARVRDDFRSGRIVDVQGWQLSRTEVRLYAIAALV